MGVIFFCFFEIWLPIFGNIPYSEFDAQRLERCALKSWLGVLKGHLTVRSSFDQLFFEKQVDHANLHGPDAEELKKSWLNSGNENQSKNRYLWPVHRGGLTKMGCLSDFFDVSQETAVRKIKDDQKFLKFARMLIR